MERFSWRYQSEFTITVLIDDQPADGIEVVPSAATQRSLANSGLIARMTGGTLSCFGRQLLNGTDWVPAYSITHPLSFSFWLRVLPGNSFDIPSLFSDPAVKFGKTIFYADNLSPTGEIDAGLAGSTLELIPDPALMDAGKGALSTYTPAARIGPGNYSVLKAGRIRPGAAVDFHLSRPISDTQTEASLDFRASRGGIFQVVLEGSPAISEQVIADESALAAGVQGVITIYKDSWRAPEPPIAYRINFVT